MHGVPYPNRFTQYFKTANDFFQNETIMKKINLKRNIGNISLCLEEKKES